MDQPKSCILFTLNPDFSLKIDLGIYEKEIVLERFAEYVRQQNKMGNWLDDLNVPNETKEQYLPQFMKLIDSVGFLMNLLKYAGIPEKDLLEMLKVPF